jgi:hypothetical protein
VIYTASKTVHAQKWRAMREDGWPIISTWIDEAGPGESASLSDLWYRCIGEAAGADVVLLYREPDEVLKGAFIETGAALACGVPVHAIGCAEFSFVNHQLVHRHDTLASALDALAQFSPARAAVSTTDTRPYNCRHRAQDEGRSHPRSSCSHCGKTITTGLGRHCEFGSVAASPPPSQEGLSAQDPDVILSGIKQFGLAPDGADLRDLAAELSRLRAELDDEKARHHDNRLVADHAYDRAEAAEAEVTRLQAELYEKNSGWWGRFASKQQRRAEVAEAEVTRLRGVNVELAKETNRLRDLLDAALRKEPPR